MEELLSLKWNNHRSTFLHILTILRDKQLYTDATLACEGRFYSVHRLVLSTCSDYFSAIFDRTTCKNPTVVLKDIKCEDLEALLDYMYLGEVNVRQAELASLIKAAECLRVKGLAVPDDEPPRKGGRSDSSKVRNSDVHSPPPKRKRREVSEDNRDDLRQSSSTPKTAHSQSRLSPIPKETIPESGQTSSNPNQSTDNSLTNNIPLENQTFVKMEMEDSGGGDDLGGSFNVSNDGYKEEEGDELEDPGGDLSNDLPEFLQQAAGSHLSSGSSFSHGSFAGTSSFQPGDMGWQGEGSNLNFPGQLNFSPTDSSSQNAPGSLQLSSVNYEDRQKKVAEDRICCYCGKQFQSPAALRRHTIIHTGEKPYSCPICDLRANRKCTIERHILSKHNFDYLTQNQNLHRC